MNQSLCENNVSLFGILGIFFITVFFIIMGCGKTTGSNNEWDTRILWTVQTGTEIYYCSPALSQNEQTVYFGSSTGNFGTPSTNNTLYALSTSTGEVLWKYSLSAEVRSTPAVAPDGSISFVSSERNPTRDVLYRLSSSGELLWSYDINPSPHGTVDVGLSAPAIASDGTVFVAAGALYAIDNAGKFKWKRFDSSAEDGSDGIIYFGHEFGRVYALLPEKGDVLWMVKTGSGITWSSPAMNALGTLFISDLTGRIYSIETARRGLNLSAPWPKFRGNNLNNGLKS